MAIVPPEIEAEDGEPAARGGPAAPVNTGRRLLLGGIPIAVTLASRPALALGGGCTVSQVLSGNLSHPLPEGLNCGCSPQTWATLAGSNQLWSRTGYTPGSSFTFCFGGAPLSSVWTIGSQSLLAALEGTLLVSLRAGPLTYQLQAGAFGAQLSAALLNASAFSPNHYPRTTSEVLAMVPPIWMQTPSSQGAAQGLLDAATAQVQSLNIN